MARSGHKCYYGECQLPDNNQRYVWQFWYVVFGAICLATSEKDFSFFSLFTFVAPVLIDLLGCTITKKWINRIRQFFIFLNAFVILVCLSGWVGFFVDDGSAFVVAKGAIVYPGAIIPKFFMLAVVVMNVFVPIMYWKASPCKRKAAITEVVVAMSAKR